MSRTLLGIDLDDSAAGRLVERLLSDEELEKLADGGRVDSDGDLEDDVADDGNDTVADDSEDTDDVGTDDADTDGADGSTGEGIRDRVPLSGDAIPSWGVDEGEEGAAEDGDDGKSLRERAKPLLLKAAVALVVLAVVALVARRYLGSAKSKASEKLGRGDDSADADDERDGVTEVDVDADATGTDDATETGEGSARGGETDTGALVGLALLALIAALVRKFAEEREYDPLVDGPEDRSE